MRWSACVVLVMAAGLTACDGDPTARNEPLSGDLYVTAPSHDETPLSCLRDADLGSVQKRTARSWRGLTPGDGHVIRVRKFSSKREALGALRDAERVAADYGGGGYVVVGTTKGSDDGPVMSVAHCLRA